jgi:hypothetical protein
VPRRHKLKYEPELLNIVLRDAQPTRSEIEREPDALRRQDWATRMLGSIYHDAEKHGELHRLDPRIRNFCERYKANHGHLPRSEGGRPPDRDRRLLIAVAIHDEVKALGPERNIESALWEVTIRMGGSYDYVKEIFYDRDPELLEAIEIERAHRKHFEAVANSAKPLALWFWEVQSTWWRPWVEGAPGIWAKGL